MPRFVFLDTEATGLDHSRHQLTEVAWILRCADGREVTRQYFPAHTLDAAEPAALELTNYDAAIADQPRTPATVWLRQFLDDANGAYLVGAVPDFDALHMRLMARTMGWEPTWNHHLIDVETLALPLIAAAPEGPRSLRRTAEALGIEHDDGRAHGALYDAQQAMAVFDAVWDTLARLRADDAPLPDVVPPTRTRDLPSVELVEVTTTRMRAAVAGLEPLPQQRATYGHPSVAHLLATTDLGPDHRSLAVVNEGTVVGHLLLRRRGRAWWVESFMVDGRFQRRGIALAAAAALQDDFDDEELRARVHPDHRAGHGLAAAAGLAPTSQATPAGAVWVRPAGGASGDVEDDAQASGDAA